MASTSYKDSRHKWSYIWIAIKHFTTPSRIYKIAHSEDLNDYSHSILHDLRKAHIIRHSRETGDIGSRHHHHHRHRHHE